MRAYAELSSTITAHAFGADDAAARSAARNAIDNNWVMLVYAPEAISVCAGLYRAYRVYKTAQAAIKVANAVSDLIDGEEDEEASQPSGPSGGGSGDGPQLPEDPEDPKKYSEKTQELVGETDKYKRELFEREGKTKQDTTLNAARKELEGEQIDLAKQRGMNYNHIEKVENAQQGLLYTIQRINKRLEYPSLPMAERQALQEELSKASKLLDYTKSFVPRN